MASTFADYLRSRWNECIQANDAELILAAQKRDKWILEKIENHRNRLMTEAERTEWSVDAILESIKTESVYRPFFRKDPSKQSIHQTCQIEWLKKHKYADTVLMPSNTDGWCFSKHKLHHITKATPRPSDATKTFDIHSASEKVYGTLKYTNEPGGAQDNQFNDVKHFIEQAVGYYSVNALAEERFEFYLDGDYYTTKKREELLAMIPEALRSKIVITSCESSKP